jgi:hypothetical protein
MAYNPFSKPINDPLDETDLQELIHQKVGEGYYVEYKGEVLPSHAKISHSIASFANSYGGWYFLGIQTDNANIANKIIGFDLNNYPDPINKVRDIVKDYIDPIPRFYIQQVNLAQANRAVLVVYVPPEQDTPFITKDGRIYRRNHDSSDPIQESNRYTIDRLVDEGQKSRRAFADFCQDERTFSKRESEDKNLGWLNIFIKPYSYEKILYPEFNKENLRKLLQKSKESFDIPLGLPNLNLTGSIPFTIIFPTPKSVVLKRSETNHSINQSLTVEFFIDGRARFHVPISYFNVDIQQFHEDDLKDYGITSPEVINFFQELSKESTESYDFKFLRFFDAGSLSLSLIILSTFYLDWLNYDNGLITDLKIAAKADGAWRVVPYFDDFEWVNYIKEFGFPLGKTDFVTFPEDLGKGLKFEIKEKYKLGSILSELMGLIFGIPFEIQNLAMGHYLQKIYDNNKNQS